MNWNTLEKTLLNNAETTAAVAANLMALASEIEAEPWKFSAFIADALAADPNALALLRRNARAHELLAAAMNDLRAAISKSRTPANGK